MAWPDWYKERQRGHSESEFDGDGLPSLTILLWQGHKRDGERFTSGDGQSVFS